MNPATAARRRRMYHDARMGPGRISHASTLPTTAAGRLSACGRGPPVKRRVKRAVQHTFDLHG